MEQGSTTLGRLGLVAHLYALDFRPYGYEWRIGT